MSMSDNYQTPEQLAQACTEHMLKNDMASQTLGMKVLSVDQGQAEVSMAIVNSMLNGHKTCHGGFIFSLADSAFAFACNSENFAAVAANCHIDYLLPAFEGDVLTASARQLHQGKRTGVYQIDIKNQDNQLIALFKGNSARINRSVLPTE